MSNNLIRYNEKNIPNPTPLVTLSQTNVSYNKDWGKDFSITLQGQLTGDYTGIRQVQSGLLNIFNRNFGIFEIFQYTGNILEYNEIIESTGFKQIQSSPIVLAGFNGLSGKYLRSKNNKTFIEVEVDGCYGGYPITWEASNNLSSWNSFLLYKSHFYGKSSDPCSIPGHGPAFNRNHFSGQSLPYTGVFRTCSHGGDVTSNPIDLNINALGLYTGMIENYSFLRFTTNPFAGGGIPLIKLFLSGIDGENIYKKNNIIINSISFDESHYNGILNYTIDLNSFEYSGNVIEPKNEFIFSENTNKTLDLTHTVSARGINTANLDAKSNALSNAINFVKTYTGLTNIPTIKLISGYNPNKLFLQNVSESIDRLNGFYQIEERYQSDLVNNNLNGILNYTVDISSGANSNSIEINIRGNYKGNLYGNIHDLRSSLLFTGITGLITNVYSGYFNPIPIQYSINENSGNNSISFDYLFDNINLPNPYFKYDASVDRNILDQICNVQVRGEMITRGNLNYRSGILSSNIINLTGQLLNVASGALSGFKDFNNITTSSNLRLLNMTIETNPKEGKLSANASYDDKFLPTGGFSDASYSISVDAPVWYMNNQPVCNINNYHIINDFDITTLPKVAVNTNAQVLNTSNLNEAILKSNIINITEKIIPTYYNFSVKVQDSYDLTKKYQNLNTLAILNYNLNKVDLNNQTGLLPKFNV